MVINAIGISKTIVKKAEDISKEVIVFNDENYTKKDRKLDKILTNSKLPLDVKNYSCFVQLRLKLG